jgi:uncharacterized membrane protein (UPF0136 family)
MTWLNIVLVVYALINIGGGVGAYLSPKIQSQASLIYGLAAGILLLISVWLSRTNRQAGYGLATVVTVALIVIFVKRYMDTQKVMPGLALAGLSVVVLVALIVGHFANSKAAS